ncbi:lantibiotic ABC transporter permease [Lactobacillus sp. 0.1XD8-4]|uniref:lantibiotic ABC transporter permease n=1 Tax=uncultured Limosilactobacillus sp. TaxID=2837629 RepID=UPI00129D5AB2|nr:lantibiotic ABC transporter permease [uncultured Limosilactobacillus sp.]MRN05859.1 lantibiotic ABC transporter permease [Lactobacillus sp. 0.1XD8-4]
MSITTIQLKQVLRNRRFILFTILLPGIWYLFMIKVIAPVVPHDEKYQIGVLLLALLMGILGNSIVTFSKRISSGKQFYLLQTHISHYSIWRYMFTQLITQLIVNFLITAIIIFLAVILRTITFTAVNLVSILLINILGIYLSIIGFTIGIIFDTPTVDAGGTPIMFILMLFIIPWNSFSLTNGFTKLFTTIQKFFPCYYIYANINHFSGNHLIMFSVTLIITVSPFIILIYYKLKK